MKATDRKRWLEYIAARFSTRHPGWERLENPKGLPYLAIFLAKQLLPGFRVFVGFYNWRNTKSNVTVGWLSRDWHPRDRELVIRYLEGEGTLEQIRRGVANADFAHADFERSLGTQIPVSCFESKSYEADESSYTLVGNLATTDIETAGFEYLDHMLKARHVEIFLNSAEGAI